MIFFFGRRPRPGRLAAADEREREREREDLPLFFSKAGVKDNSYEIKVSSTNGRVQATANCLHKHFAVYDNRSQAGLLHHYHDCAANKKEKKNVRNVRL
jgi:hypothetical protein